MSKKLGMFVVETVIDQAKIQRLVYNLDVEHETVSRSRQLENNNNDHVLIYLKQCEKIHIATLYILFGHLYLDNIMIKKLSLLFSLEHFFKRKGVHIKV